MRVVIIDNYDSFVYNLAQYIGGIGVQCEVVRNDIITPEEAALYDGIVISPGPGTPSEKRYFGVCGQVISQLGDNKPILGVCLGHQGIIEAYGGRVSNAGAVRHGKTSPVIHDGTGILEGMASPFRATRYHSLAGEKTSIPDCLHVNAIAGDDGEVMAVRHRSHPVSGVQFHPESIMTQNGIRILENFLEEIRR